ncbi:hypothetical protein BaRGS_00006469 [Batillaria attramentaria]|uniref:Uncharacterized protein n=1 Tax=Batillaria attramentaria TaxID=370345 RepID=A0ABD0LRE2_9CAEN
MKERERGVEGGGGIAGDSLGGPAVAVGDRGKASNTSLSVILYGVHLFTVAAAAARPARGNKAGRIRLLQQPELRPSVSPITEPVWRTR